jgi:hypothetical protein
MLLSKNRMKNVGKEKSSLSLLFLLLCFLNSSKNIVILHGMQCVVDGGGFSFDFWEVFWRVCEFFLCSCRAPLFFFLLWMARRPSFSTLIRLISRRYKQKAYKYNTQLGKFARLTSVREALVAFGCPPHVTHYWRKKVQDPIFHPKANGGVQ